MKDYKIASPTTISYRYFELALQNRKSPAQPLAAECFRVCEAWGVNPAVALAFFVHESNCGTRGAAVKTKNWGNLRSGPGAIRIADTGVSGGFGVYASWVVSLNDFCRLLRGQVYEGMELKTVRQVLPRYAPSGDNNNPTAYADFVNSQVSLWQRMSFGTEGGGT